MTPTKSQQAQEYAEKKLHELLLTIEKEPWPRTRALLAKAYLDGYTAAEQSMWRSVEEELLYCDKSIVQDMANSAIRSIQIHDYEGNTIASQNLATFNRGVKFALETLYGSKCLPDVPSKLQASCRQVKEPNGTIDDTKGSDYSNATKIGKDCNDDSAHHFADAGKMVDHIADVSNMIPARLHIAAMAMQGMLSNPEFGKKYLGYLHCCHKGDDVIDETLYYAQKALNLADTLINEAESSAQPLCPAKKGGSEHGED